MGKESDLQVMQETLRLVLLALCASSSIDRAALAKALTAMCFAPGIDPQTRLCLQDLAEGMTAIAPGAGPKQ